MAEVRAAPEEGMQANGADTAPAAGMISQYVKDLSFENPNAPGIFQRPSGAQPQIDVQFNIGANQIGDEVHEVLLKLRSEEHTSELQALMRTSYHLFCFQ